MVRVSEGPTNNLMGEVLEMKECYREAEESSPHIPDGLADYMCMEETQESPGKAENQGELRSGCKCQCVLYPQHRTISSEMEALARWLLVQCYCHCPYI